MPQFVVPDAPDNFYNGPITISSDLVRRLVRQISWLESSNTELQEALNYTRAVVGRQQEEIRRLSNSSNDRRWSKVA